MAEVAENAEAALPYERWIVEKRGQLQPQTDDAIAYDACQTAHQLNAALIVAFTESGATAGRVSKYRPKPPILALTQTARGERRLTPALGSDAGYDPKARNRGRLLRFGRARGRRGGQASSR